MDENGDGLIGFDEFKSVFGKIITKDQKLECNGFEGTIEDVFLMIAKESKEQDGGKGLKAHITAKVTQQCISA